MAKLSSLCYPFGMAPSAAIATIRNRQAVQAWRAIARAEADGAIGR